MCSFDLLFDGAFSFSFFRSVLVYYISWLQGVAGGRGVDNGAEPFLFPFFFCLSFRCLFFASAVLYCIT